MGASQGRHPTQTLGSLADLEASDSFLRAAAHVSAPAAPPFLARQGRAIAGRYQLDKLLGRGGCGEVWEADDGLSGERVAIKLLRPGTGHLLARACREVAALRLLRLPGVVRLIDEGIHDGHPFLVMERVAGEPFPGAPVPCSWPALEGPLVRLLEALARVHAAGLVHRDLKPGNILVDAEGKPTILDFGLTHVSAPEGGRITDAGTVLGTPAYLAPEQICEEPITARTDLYAVGVIAFYALAGRLPHDAKNLTDLLYARLYLLPPKLASLAPEVPAHVAALIDQLLARDPAERPRSAAEVADRLRGERAPRTPLLLRLEGGSDKRGGPLDEAALRDLFVGPDRLLHLREDGARALFARTGGAPARVARELDAWTRAGLARWDGERIAIDRDALEHLLPEGPELVASHEWTDAQFVEKHLSLAAALSPGAPGRLGHLLAAAEAVEPAAIAAEATASAARLAAAGGLARAVGHLAEGLCALRRGADVPTNTLEALLACWVEVALTDGSPGALDRVLYELCRPGLRTPLLEPLTELVRAALAVNAWTERAAQLAEAVPPFAEARLERLRLGVRVLSARRSSLAREEEVLDEVRRFAEASGDEGARASHAAWLGRLRYCQNRFEEAAQLADEAAEGAAWLPQRIAARLDGASAWMEAFRLEEAAARVAEGAALAARCRHALLEGRAAWLSRCIGYRAGQTDGAGPEEELVEAAAQLGSAHLEALIGVAEAAIAYRAGDREAARRLAGRAHRSFRGAGHPLGTLLSGALFVAAGGALSAADVEVLAARARACPVPSVGLQVLALLAEGGFAVTIAEADLLAMAAHVPRRFWEQRLDVLSVKEAMARLAERARNA